MKPSENNSRLLGPSRYCSCCLMFVQSFHSQILRDIIFHPIVDNLITLLGIITAGLLTSGENVIRLKDGEFTRKPPHFAGHCTILSISTLISQLGMIFGGYIYDRGKCGSGKIWRNYPGSATLYRS